VAWNVIVGIEQGAQRDELGQYSFSPFCRTIAWFSAIASKPVFASRSSQSDMTEAAATARKMPTQAAETLCRCQSRPRALRPTADVGNRREMSPDTKLKELIKGTAVPAPGNGALSARAPGSSSAKPPVIASKSPGLVRVR
jgi:hypothetical protein